MSHSIPNRIAKSAKRTGRVSAESTSIRAIDVSDATVSAWFASDTYDRFVGMAAVGSK